MQKFVSLLLIIMILTLVSCSSSVQHEKAISDSPNEMIEEYEHQDVSFVEAVESSNACFVGEYVELIRHDAYCEYKFRVKEVIFGVISEPFVFIYAPLFDEEEEESETDIKKSYVVGMNYILVTQKNSSIMYDHDRYVPVADLFLNTDTNTYLVNGTPVVIPEDMTMQQYLLSLKPNAATLSVVTEAVEYDNEIHEMAEVSTFIGYVTVDSLFTEGRVGNNNTYRCHVTELLKGTDLLTDGGSIIMSVLKGTVEVGETYLIGFNPVDVNSIIYRQSTVSSVYPNSADIADALLSYIGIE